MNAELTTTLRKLIVRATPVGSLCLAVAFMTYARAQEVEDAYVKSWGSSAAMFALCEKEGFIPVGSASEYLRALRQNTSKSSSDKIIRQYQTSLHEKQLYSPVKDKWFRFSPTGANCSDIYKAYPSMLYHFRNLNK